MAKTHSITRRAFVRAASAVTAAIGTGAVVAVAAPVDPKERVKAAIKELKAALKATDPSISEWRIHLNERPPSGKDCRFMMVAFDEPTNT